MTFSAVCDVTTLKAFFAPSSAIADECKVHLNEDGLQSSVVDPANVAMDSVDLGTEGFESYNATGGIIGLNIGRIEDILSFGKAGDLVHLELNEDTRKLDIAIGDLSYTMALIDPDSIRQEPDLPSLEDKLPVDVRLNADDLVRGITAADLVTDHIQFEADPDAGAIHILGMGDTDDVDLRLGRDDLLEGSTIDEEASSLFSLDYFKDMKKAIPSGAEVRGNFGTEFPVKLHYTDAEGDVSVQYLLAPRITGD